VAPGAEVPAPTLTGVRRERPGRVALEVDGSAWRVVPDDVVARCGLAPGVALERPLLRRLRRELRRAEALGAATRSLARRDLSARRLRERLDARGIRAPAAEAALAELLPEPERAAALAEGASDRRAAWRLLARRGFSSDSIEHAVGALDEDA
jgi:hypothetical protein